MTKPGPLCHLCPLNEAEGPVWGDGSPSAELIVIGQNPGPQEIAYVDEYRRGKPFIGASGKMLDNVLVEAGSARSQCFVSNIVKCYVPPRHMVPRKAVECCRPLLEQELACVHSKTVLTVGAEPFNALTSRKFTTVMNRKADKKDPKRWLRGCVHRDTGYTIVPTIHPSYIMSTGFHDLNTFRSDVRKAVRLARGQGRHFTEYFNYSATDEEVIAEVDRAIQQGWFGLDIETPESDDKDDAEVISLSETEILIVGISTEVGRCIGVRPSQFALLTRLFAHRARPLVCYVFYQGFENFHMGKRYDLSGVEFYDVRVAMNVLYSNLQGKNLGIALSLFTELDYTKNLGASNPERYNATDTYGAVWAGQNAQKDIETMHLEDVRRTDQALWPIVEDMRVRGFRVDVPRAMQMEMFCMQALEKYESAWAKMLPTVDWKSSQQLVALFTAQGLPQRYKTRVDKNTKERKKTPTVDVDVLEEYRDYFGSQTAALVLLMRQLKKASEFTHTYSSDGYAHSTYDICGQKMGRIQAEDPDIQNVPEILLKTKNFPGVFPRTLYVPDTSDDVIIVADFEQIEFWVYAYAAQDQSLLLAKKRGEYIYGQFYEDIFHKPFFEAGKPRRKIFKAKSVGVQELLMAKSIPLGMLYGRGGRSIAGMFNLSTKEGDRIYSEFFRAHPAIRRLHDRRMQDAKRDGYLRNFFSRIRRFPHAGIMRNELLAFDGQSNAADILRRRALIPLFRDLPAYGARLLFTVHDSIGINCPRKYVKRCCELIRDTMESPIPEMSNYWIPCEITVGPNWGETIPYEDFTG